MSEFIGHKSKPGEVKHLSSQRKRKQKYIPQVGATEKGSSLASVFNKKTWLVESSWKGLPKRVKAS